MLSDNMLAVPAFQRPYAWEEEQVSQLLTDLDASIRKERSGGAEYFLGSIVLAYQNRERAEVVDGQQRLATASILLAAIRDYFIVANDKHTAELIESRYLLARHIRTLQMIPRLKLNERDDEYFSTRILRGQPVTLARSDPGSVQRISRAAELARKHVARVAERSESDPRESLIDWVTFLEKRVQVIVVEVPGDSDAFTIFETLNDRGAEMEVTDLLKNHLLRLAGRERLPEVGAKWTKVLNTLEGESPRATPDFVRHLWSSKCGLTRERQLYTRIRDAISTRSAALGFATELAKAAPTYAAILDTDHVLWDHLGARARGYANALDRIGVVAMRPLLLAVMQEFEAPEVEHALRIFVSWATRLFVVGSLGSGALEQMYSELAVSVRGGKIRTARDFLATKVAPTDAEFEQAFMAHAPRKASLAKYYLSALENEAQGRANPTLGDLGASESVGLMYVRPPDEDRVPGANPEGDNIARLLGNAVLLEVALNVGAENFDFGRKRQLYARSQFELTREVSKFRKWDLDSIRQRQARLAKLAPKAWKISM